jgi:hypothetical protein
MCAPCSARGLDRQRLGVDIGRQQRAGAGDWMPVSSTQQATSTQQPAGKLLIGPGLATLP